MALALAWTAADPISACSMECRKLILRGDQRDNGTRKAVDATTGAQEVVGGGVKEKPWGAARRSCQSYRRKRYATRRVMQSEIRGTRAGMQSYMSAQVAQQDARSEIGCGTAAGGIRRAGCVQSLEGSDSDVV